MIATNIQQSKHLLELGLNPDSADMFYFSYGMFRPMKLHVGKILEDVVTGKRQWAIPAWSLSALLEVMKEHCPELLFLEAYWYCRCMQVESEYCDDSITAVYDVLCWLLERGLIKKGDNDESKS